jgi:hypothetical protein
LAVQVEPISAVEFPLPLVTFGYVTLNVKVSLLPLDQDVAPPEVLMAAALVKDESEAPALPP